MSTIPCRSLKRLAACVTMAVACASPLEALADQDDYGKALVEANCARCHAIGRVGDSAHPDAPPFRDLHLRYPLDALEEAFAEGITTGHPDMPEFIATPDQIAAIIGYIESLSR